MAVVLGIIMGLLILLVLFILAADIILNNKLNNIRDRQGRLEGDLGIAKDHYARDMRNNNKEIAKELSKLESNSTCFAGFIGTESNRIPVSDILIRFIVMLGYDLKGREFKIIKKGDQGSGQVREETKTVCKGEKAKKN